MKNKICFDLMLLEYNSNHFLVGSTSMCNIITDWPLASCCIGSAFKIIEYKIEFCANPPQ